MKILLGLVLTFALAANSYSMPLVFKVTKEIKANDANTYQEIATLDTSKYKQIRVGLVLSGVNQKEKSSVVRIEAVEADDFMLLGALSFGYGVLNNSIEINNLPNRIRIVADEPCTYKIYVWATQ